MKRILLTTTSLILAAGVVSAETSISWSGAATAGIAREGSAAAVTAGVQSKESTDNQVDVIAAVAANVTNNATYLTFVLATVKADIAAIEVLTAAGGADANTLSAVTSETLLRGDLVLLKASALDMPNGSASEIKAVNTAIRKAETILDESHGVVAVAKAKAGDWKSYSEVSTTVTGSVTADNGMTITAAVSVDAGTGYDFADDDGFDAAKTNGVGLDNITIATAMGTFKLDENAITHLVDGDDDAAADIMYTNTFGSASVSVAIDANKDTDVAFAKAAKTVITKAITTTTVQAVDATAAYTVTQATAATAQDVAWSAKISMPVGGGSAFVAMDEEGGNNFGASTTLGGVGLSFSSKLEALESEQKKDRSNSLGLTYALGATTLGASWNSVEDGDQWGISAAYAADGMTISASTDEGSDWAISGSYLMGTGASVVGGVNYTEDAYLGLSFA